VDGFQLLTVRRFWSTVVVMEHTVAAVAAAVVGLAVGLVVVVDVFVAVASDAVYVIVANVIVVRKTSELV